MERRSGSGDRQQLTLHFPWFLGVSPLSWAVPLRQHQQSSLVPANKLILVCGTASPQPWAYQDSLSWWVPSPYGSSQQSKRLWCHDHWHFLAWVWWKNYAKPPSILVRLSAHGLQGLTRAVTWHGQPHY